MRRRGFLTAALGGAFHGLRARRVRADSKDMVESVGGPLDASRLGTTLVHEHVMVDFGGAATASRSRYDAEAVFRSVLPHLEELGRRGCRTLFECTPAYLGRDPLLLLRLAEASGLQIVTNTGYYGAAKDIAVPKHAYDESARQLAARFVAEFRKGIEGTSIRPGFVKVGVDAGPLSPIDRKLVEAGALTHRETGLTIAVHTGDGRAAREIVNVLAERGVAPSAYVWVHAQNEPDPATRGWAAQQGAFVELDGVSPGSLDAHVEAVLDLRRRGHLERVLVSQDAGWYHVGEPGGGSYRSHTFLFDGFVPALRAAGLTEADVERLLVLNPAEAFAIRRRLLQSSPAAGAGSAAPISSAAGR